MKRWWIAFVFAVLACLPIGLARSTSPSMLADTDTAVLLASIRERKAPLSWFTGDWPLGNHFYRPVSTLVFELDNRLHGDDAAGYGRTQALLIIGGVLALFWFVRELTDRPLLAAASSGLLALWQLDLGKYPASWLGWAALGVAVVALGRRLLLRVRDPNSPILIGSIALAAFAIAFAGHEVAGQALRHRTLDWLPGRTATTMTLFCLLALASFARFERTRARTPVLRPASATDLPATRTSMVDAPRPRAWLFALASCVFLALALGSYEQAVMLPAALVGVTITFRLMRPGAPEDRRVWLWHGVFWALLVGYLLLRRTVLPTDVSGYQAQQFRVGPGVGMSILDYLLPGSRGWVPLRSTLEGAGPEALFIPAMWSALALMVGNVAAIVLAARDRRWPLVLSTFLLSVLAFLPMAWLKPFAHYHHWPAAMRAPFVALLLLIVASAALSAVSPPALRAPPRRDPAPGSLPRRSSFRPSS